MALGISYSPQFFDSLEDILNYFDERNGSNRFSKKLLKMIHKQIKLASAMPEIKSQLRHGIDETLNEIQSKTVPVIALGIKKITPIIKGKQTELFF